MISRSLYLCQRVSAAIMIPLVIAHIIVMMVALQNGLSAQEILSRTQGSYIWFFVYQLFVLSASIHAAIGTSVILHEWCKIRPQLLVWWRWGFGFLLVFMGGRAVFSLTFG